MQAIGAALVLPAAIAEIGTTSSKENAGKMMGLLLSMSAFAMIIGPNLGGYLIQNFGWRTIFYFNTPLGIRALLTASEVRENDGKIKQHIDVMGSILLTGAVASLLLGLVRLVTHPLHNISVYPLLLVSALLTVIFILFERKITDPILDISLLARTMYFHLT